MTPTQPGYYWARRLHNDSCVGYEPAQGGQSWGPWKVLHLIWGSNYLGPKELRLRTHDFDYQGEPLTWECWDWGPSVLPPEGP